MPFTYRSPSFRAWAQRLRRGRGPVTPVLKPHCDLTIFSQSSTTAPSTVQFVELATLFGPPLFLLSPPFAGKPTSWLWDFGDGTPTSTTRNPLHVYNNPGSFTVTLTATNSAGSDVCVKLNLIVLDLTNSVSIRRLDDSELLSASLKQGQTATAMLFAREAVSVKCLNSMTSTRIRRLDDSPLLSAKLRAA